MTPRSSAAIARQEEESYASVLELGRDVFVRDSGISNESQIDEASACISGTEARAYSGSIPVAKKPLHYRLIKRLFDIVFSTCVIVAGFVPGLILSLLIVLDTKGSPIYSQVRCGRDGKPFRIYKFRSMVADSDDVEKYFTPEQLELWKRERKVEDDPRITPLGRMLRSLSIDEFPQFINVLLGQIAAVTTKILVVKPQVSSLRAFEESVNSFCQNMHTDFCDGFSAEKAVA